MWLKIIQQIKLPHDGICTDKEIQFQQLVGNCL